MEKPILFPWREWLRLTFLASKIFSRTIKSIPKFYRNIRRFPQNERNTSKRNRNSDEEG